MNSKTASVGGISVDVTESCDAALVEFVGNCAAAWLRLGMSED